jgi:hypothetical protein
VVDVSQSLGVRRERTTGYLRKAIGDPVQAGEVLAQRSVITAVGALIQGVWGSAGGKSPSHAHGELRIVVDNAEEPLHAEALGTDCRGTLVVAGRILDTSVLEQAAEVRIQGLIVGSVNADLCHLLRSLPYPVLVTERFGTLPMSRQAFSLLQYCTGRQAVSESRTDASRRDAPRRDVAEPPERPEVFVPFELEGAPSAPAEGTLPPEEPGPHLL